MKISKQIKEELSWEIDYCESKAVVENGLLLSFYISQKGVVSGTSGIKVEIPNEGRLREVHKAMSELIQHLDKGRNLDNFVREWPIAAAQIRDEIAIDRHEEKGFES